MISRYLDITVDIKNSRSLFLFGPRGVGKTSLLNRLNDCGLPYLYFNLLKRNVRQPLEADPELFSSQVLAKLPTSGLLIVAVDEVQLVPDILHEVHSLIEENKGSLVFVLTGSSSRKLKRTQANLLAGRAITRELHPLSSIECDIDVFRAVSIGTLPAIYLDSKPEELLDSYVDTYLREEIQQEAVTRNLQAFSRFLELAAQLNGTTINYAKIGRTLGFHHSTIQDWFSILVDTLIATRIDGWSHSVKRQLVQAPKFYFFDCGVLRALLRELALPIDRSNYRFGMLFENFLVQEIVRYNKYQNLHFRLNHWRTKTGQEVDVILSRSITEPPIAIEIKSGASPSRDDVSGLLAFHEEEPNALLWCLCQSEFSYRKDNVEFFPWKEGLAKLEKV